jgi:hypothetical protein
MVPFQAVAPANENAQLIIAFHGKSVMAMESERNARKSH